MHHALLQGGIARADELKSPLIEAQSPSLFVHLDDPLGANKTDRPFSRATNLPTGAVSVKPVPNTSENNSKVVDCASH